MNNFTKWIAIPVLLFCAIPCFGKAVNETTAKAAASNFLASKGINISAAGIVTDYVAQQSTGKNTITCYYVFTIAGNGGWVIIAGDDQVIPVLAYSTNSKFNISHPAPSTQKWLKGYENQVASAIKNHVAAREGTADRWKALITGTNSVTERTTAVSPLVTTTWDQEPYYNVLCPYDHTYLALTATGCVATAMAQVMKYWNWPTIGCGFHYYEDDPYGILSANFGKTAYQWSAMPSILTGPNNAVAILMYHAGISVDMAYGTDATDGSGAFINTIESTITPCAEFALKANFHYKKSLRSLYRFGEGPGSGYDTIPEATWISTLKTELDASRPIIYGGENDTVGGHCWVCDGYDATNNFHFNWGWSGLNDGYYTVDNLDPASLGVGGGGGNFNYDQTAIIGIEPDSFPSNPGNMQMLSYLNTSNTPAEYGGAFSISAKIINTSSIAFSGDFCAQVFDTSNTLAGTVQSITGQVVAAGDSTGLLTFGTTGMYNLVTGIYGVRLFWRASGDTTWVPMANNGNFINYTSIAIANDTDLELNSAMAISPGINLGTHGTVSVTANIYNGGTTAFYGGLEATLNSVVDGSQLFMIQALSGQYIDTYATNSFTFTNSSLSLSPGTYVLEIKHQYTSGGSYYLTGSTYACNPVLVNVAWQAGVPQVGAAADFVIYPNPARDFITIDLNGLSAHQLVITDIAGRQMYKTIIDNKASVSFSLADYPAGIYLAQVQTDNEVITKKFVVEK